MSAFSLLLTAQHITAYRGGKMMMMRMQVLSHGAANIANSRQASKPAASDLQYRFQHLNNMGNKKLAGKRILITAGPTREAIDTVRFISNRSTGRVGYALAEEFLQQGAHVFLVTGPLCINLHHPRLVTVKVNTASEMYLACCRYFEQVDVAVFTAAVSDYKAAKISASKLNDEHLMIKLVRNIDIAAEFGKVKTPSQLSIGFLQEANASLARAEQKIEEKNFDMVVLHSVGDFHAGSDDRNRITIIKKDLAHTSYPVQNEIDAARDICLEMNIALTHADLAEWEENEQAYEVMYK